MITIHCLAYSRALRVIWLMEHLGADYALERYDRTESFEAPDALKKVHPLGKSPTIEDGDLVLTESATILRYVVEKHGAGGLLPETGTSKFWLHEQWLDYAESSLGVPVMASLMASMQDKEVPEKIAKELKTNLGFVQDTLKGQDFLLGDSLTVADIQMSYLVSLVAAAGMIGDYPEIDAYWKRLKEQPGLKKAESVAGPMKPPFGD